MKATLFKPIVLIGVVAITVAATPPGEQLLPIDTIAILDVPDCRQFAAAFRDAPTVRFWNDPAMTKFRQKFTERLTEKLIMPLETQLGIKTKEVVDLFQGQLTLGVTLTGWEKQTNSVPSITLIVDSRDKTDQLKQLLSVVRAKLAESNHKIRSERIRDIEFITCEIHPVLPVSSTKTSSRADYSTGTSTAAEPGANVATADPPRSVELTFGQAGSLLIVSTCLQDLQKVIARIQGGNVPSLAEKPAFEIAHRIAFRDAAAFAWTDLSAIYKAVLDTQAGAVDQTHDKTVPAEVEKLLPTIGFAGMKSIACAIRNNVDGTFVDLFLAVPQEDRKGIFKMFSFDPKEAEPPPWVPADVLQFSRLRLDGQKSWAAIESTINEISPGVLSFLIDQLNEAIRLKDPAFDFRRYFVQNLGDDMISYEKLPRDVTEQQLSSPPAIHLFASPQPERLIAAIKAVTLLLPAPLNTFEFKEREFQGKRILSLVPPSVAFLGAQSSSTSAIMHLCAAGGYLAVANDSTILEEFVRAPESRTRSLSQIPGWQEAVKQVGGSHTGFLGYQNMAETVRILFAILKSTNSLDALRQSAGAFSAGMSQATGILGDYADFALLPDFEAVSKYFGIFVCAGATLPEGYTLRCIFHTPPNAE